MKTKQDTLRAVIAKPAQNAVNMGGDKETIEDIRVTDKKSEREVITCRVYTGRSRNASTVYASVWVYGLRDKDGNVVYTSGRGSAGGYGYHKVSAAIQEALTSAGIELYGTPYSSRDEKVDFKQRAYINGVGDGAVKSALLAVAYAVGCKDAIYS